MITKAHTESAASKGGATAAIAIVSADADYHHKVWTGVHNAYLRRLPHLSREKSVSIALNHIGRMFSSGLDYPFLSNQPSPPLRPESRCYLNTVFQELQTEYSALTSKRPQSYKH